jgi:hypothetical protein
MGCKAPWDAFMIEGKGQYGKVGHRQNQLERLWYGEGEKIVCLATSLDESPPEYI